VLQATQRNDIFVGSRNDTAIRYDTTPGRDPVGELGSRLDSGGLRLAFDPVSGYLTSVLAALRVPVESQGLVFSQSSAQFERMSPTNPRAVYFNDSAAVAWVRGADVLELAGVDPVQGTIFYTLRQEASNRPELARRNDCLLCHQSAETLGVPGPLLLSTFQMSDDPHAYASGIPVDHRTPADERWGGWYVTGRLGAAWHLGNVPVVVPQAQLERPKSPPPYLASLDGAFDTRGYPTLCSDPVSLTILAHQTRMANLITRAGWEARSGSDDDRVDEAALELVDYMLFVDEAPMVGRIESSCGFTEWFASSGPSDRRGRSLRQLAPQGRLLRFPCSYMVYSPAFDALPAKAQAAVYRRLWRVLSGQDQDAKYARLSLADRLAIVEILRDTKTGLPTMFWGSVR
jgi:hypothetical protein